jgi:hypothetical protein
VNRQALTGSSSMTLSVCCAARRRRREAVGAVLVVRQRQRTARAEDEVQRPEALPDAGERLAPRGPDEPGSHDGQREPVALGRAPCDPFLPHLRHRVAAAAVEVVDGLDRRRVLGEAVADPLPVVHRDAARQDQARNPSALHGRQQALRPADRRRELQVLVAPHRSREMDHGIDAVHRNLDVLGPAQVRAHDVDARGVREVGAACRANHGADVVAAPVQRAHDVPPEEAARSGHQDLHRTAGAPATRSSISLCTPLSCSWPTGGCRPAPRAEYVCSISRHSPS